MPRHPRYAKKERGFVVVNLLCMYKIFFSYVSISWHALKIVFVLYPSLSTNSILTFFFFFQIAQRKVKTPRRHSSKNNDAGKYPANAAFFAQISQRKQKKDASGEERGIYLV